MEEEHHVDQNIVDNYEPDLSKDEEEDTKKHQTSSYSFSTKEKEYEPKQKKLKENTDIQNGKSKK